MVIGHCECNTMGSTCFHDPVTPGGVRGHGLLEQDMLARPRGGDGLGLVQPVGRGNDHAVELRVGQQRVEVGMDGDRGL